MQSLSSITNLYDKTIYIQIYNAMYKLGRGLTLPSLFLFPYKAYEIK